MSHLSTGFDQLGRVGPWSSTTTHGNPILSTVIGNYRKGFRLQAWRSGYLEGSAVPLTEDKVFQLVAYIDSLQPASTSPTAALALEHDAVLVLLWWESSLRGNNVGCVSLSDFFTLSGQPLHFPLSRVIQLGDQIQLVVNGTKTIKGDKGPSYRLHSP